MPSRAVPRKIRDFIFYYYAKLVIAPSAGEAKNYRFIIDRYKRLKSGEIQMSNYDREIQKLAQQPGVCAFCGRPGGNIVTDVIPSISGGPVGLENKVYACRECSESKRNKNLLDWWCNHLGRDKDDLPRIPAGLFLKIAYERHTVNFSLERPCNSIHDIWP